MRIAMGFFAAASLLGQTRLLSPTSEFDLAPAQQTHLGGESVRWYFGAGPAGLSFVEISHKYVSLTSTNLNGQILYSTRKLVSGDISPTKAVFLPDGSLWLVSTPTPFALDENRPVPNVMNSESNRANMVAQTVQANNSFDVYAFGPGGFYLDLRRYSPMGKRLESLRFARPAGVGSETLMAASTNKLILRTGGHPVGVASSESEGLEFGTLVRGKFKRSMGFHLDPPVTDGVPIRLSNGDLLLIRRGPGSIDVIDPKLQKGRLVRFSSGLPVKAAASDGNSVYLLSGDAVLKTDVTGTMLATFRFQMDGSFYPAFVGVVGRAIYLVDKDGHAKRFDMN